MLGIIPAAGKGMRFKELGKQYPKTILPYKETPILIHQIKWLIDSGCDRIRIVVGHQKEKIIEILQLYDIKDVELVVQEEQEGLAHAIYKAVEDQRNQEGCLIVLGDMVINSKPYFDVEDRTMIGVQTVDDYKRWCMVGVESSWRGAEHIHVLKKLYDKPKEQPDTNFAACGIYYFNDILDLKETLSDIIHYNNRIEGEFQISTYYDILLRSGEDISVHVFDVTDFGTLDEYLKNRSVKNSRSFNNLVVSSDRKTIRKESQDVEKLTAEYSWFNMLPPEVAYHTPRMFDHNIFASYYPSYTMEYIRAPSLREIYLFLDSSLDTWKELFAACFDVLNIMGNFASSNKLALFMQKNFDKTISRIANLPSHININEEKISDFLLVLETQVDTMLPCSCVMHGDFCFSNLLYDFGANKLVMIDPRGEVFGDHYYEVAKLAHSVLFDYDFIDTELYTLNDDGVIVIYNDGKENIKQYFWEMLLNDYNEKEIRYIMTITASLFISMIPLHSHSELNQKIYYAIFENIVNEFVEKEISTEFRSRKTYDLIL